MRVAFSADHAGAALKDELIRRLAAAGTDHDLIDLGGDGSDPDDDYSDFAQRLGEAIVGGDAERGILICGSGVGASVAANKIRGIRAAMCTTKTLARYAREHNGANVLTLGATLLDPDEALGIVDTFLATPITEPRYLRRLGKIHRLEQGQ
jgi:ribose 5-phosphate isomerase B